VHYSEGKHSRQAEYGHFGVDKQVFVRVCLVATSKSCVKRSGDVAVEHSRKQYLSRKNSFATAIGVEIMSAMSSTLNQPAMFAGKDRTQRMSAMPSAMSAMCMASAAASTIIMGTGAIVPVSLFVVVLLVSIILLVALVVLLTLSSLTGLLISSVGLSTGLDPSAAQGD
jgi:hypothetical protein